MITVSIHDTIGAIDAGEWDGLTSGAIDQSHCYLSFRELVEPGDPVVAVAQAGGRAVAALHGSGTVAGTALFSHPWKMLASPQFLRASELGDPASAARSATHDSLLRRLCAGRGEGPAWERLAAALGEVTVFRGFDTTSAALAPDLPGDQRTTAMLALLGALKNHAAAGVPQGIALPFVHPLDDALRAALASSGFCRGVLTGVTVFDTSGAGSLDEFQAAQPKGIRRRYRSDLAAFGSSGMSIRTVTVTGCLDRLVELEAANLERHGGTPDRARLAATRSSMARLLGQALRVIGIERDGSLVACGIDLVDDRNYLGLVYGCDYAEPDLPLAYRQLVCYEPVRYATSRGLGQVRMGFEAFEPKLYRGARLETREMWMWLADEAAMGSLADLLEFLSVRSMAYFAGLVDTESDYFLAPLS